MTMPKRPTIRLVDIAELLGVSKQRVHQLAAGSDFPSGRRGSPRPAMGSTRGHGVGEDVAGCQALAIAMRAGLGSLDLYLPEDEAVGAQPRSEIVASSWTAPVSEQSRDGRSRIRISRSRNEMRPALTDRNPNST